MQNIIKQLNKIKRNSFKKLFFKFSKNSFYVALSILVIFSQFSFPKIARATSGVIPINSSYTNLTIDGAASITATGTTAATNSITVTGTLTINAGVTLTLISYDNGDANYTDGSDSGVIINAANIINNGTISADGKGYPGGAASAVGKGTGGGTAGGWGLGAGGGGYGGKGGGGNANTAGGGVTYFSGTAGIQPILLGSGGGGSYSGVSGAGGGAMKLAVSGTLTNNGTISANGVGSTVDGVYNAGSGSGGSIWVVAGTLTGTTSGVFSANGGNSFKNYLGGGAGGGGRIHLNTSSTDSYNGSIKVAGGSGYFGGEPGSVVRDGAAMSTSDINISSGTVTWTRGDFTFRNLTIASGATLTTGVAIGSSWGGYDNVAAVGLGGGKSTLYSSGGGGHAGAGRRGWSADTVGGGAAYNTGGNQVIQPTDLGSGGGGTYYGAVSGYNDGGSGGGALKITLSGTLTNNGTISADGGAPGAGSAYGPGGGGGGSLWFISDIISGSGIFSAKGSNGSGSSYPGGGGGGGRMSFSFNSTSSFSPSSVTVAGGTGYVAGGVGTINGLAAFSSITSPTSSAIVNSLATVSGTAVDYGGGTLSYVDITLQRASDSYYYTGSAWSATETWLRATGTSTWSYSILNNTGWVDSNITIKSRATSSTSTETPGSGITFTYDHTGPTVTLFSATADPTNGTIAVRATFNESVANFVVGDITVGNGTAGTFTGSGTTYTFVVTPSVDGTVTVDIAGGAATDTAGNGNTAATQLTRVYDTTIPLASTITAICSVGGNGCTTPGQAASPQEIYSTQSITGTATDNVGGSGIGSVKISIQDKGISGIDNGNYLSAVTSFTDVTETYITTTGTNTWSFDSSTVPLVIDHIYLIHIKSIDSALNEESPVQALSFKFVNSPPVVSNVTASMASSGIVTVGYDVTDVESTQTTNYLYYLVDATLNGTITSGATPLTVSDATHFPSSGTILIDDEMISYASKSGNILQTLTRGALSTTAAAHTTGASIYLYASSATGTGIGLSNKGIGKVISWTARTDADGYENATETIKVVANDGSAGSMIGTLASSAFIFDAKKPTAVVTFDAGSAGVVDSATITIPMPTDISTVEYLITDGASEADATTSGWISITTSTTIPWTFDSDIEIKNLKYQYRDAYGNTTLETITSTLSPILASSFLVQDTSNITIPSYDMYIGWKALVDTTGFASYNLEYATSTDNVTFGAYASVGDSMSNPVTNYYVHRNLDSTKFYRYRLGVVGTDGNTSIRAGAFTTAKPDGVQNYGEGGGGSVATASKVENVVPTQDTTTKDVTITYRLTDGSLAQKVGVSYEARVFYNIGITLPSNAYSGGNLTVSDASKLQSSGYIQVNNEVIQYTGKTGNILTGLTRGTWPTSPRATRQNLTFFAGTPVWVMATTTTPTTITNSTISAGQDGSITWTTYGEPALAGSSYTNVGVRVLVHDNQDPGSGPISSQNDYSENGILNTFNLTAPTITFDAATSSGLESVTPATFGITLSRAYPLNSDFIYTVTGTAVGGGVDYTLASGTATITAGQTTTSLSATIVDHATVRASKTIIITLSNPINATLGANTTHTYTIINHPADTTLPVITLTGGSTLHMTVNTAFSDPGATASDDVDGNLTSSIVVDSSSLNVNLVSVDPYPVTYTVTDSSGNVGTATLNVYVDTNVDNTAPIPSAPTAIAQKLKIGVTSSSTVQTNEAGSIYLVKHGAKPTPDATASADLTNITMSGTPSGYTYAATTYNYNGVTVPNATSSVTITASGAGVITVDGTIVPSGSDSSPIALTAGTERAIDIVTTETGKAQKIYTIRVTRAAAALAVGQSYQGGKIAYLNGSGGGFIAATADISVPLGTDYQWGCYNIIVPGADGTAIGTGYQNTLDIINNGCVTSTSSSTLTAAYLARNYNGSGYTDWYLPSKDELNQLYANRTAIGGFSTGDPSSNTWYWTSSEWNNNRTEAWFQSFYITANGAQMNTAKSNVRRIRPIRSFSATTTPLQSTPISFSPTAGAVPAGTTVTIASYGADAFYYTTDGSTPTTASTNQATTPLVINGNTTVKVLAVKAGYYNQASSAQYTTNYDWSTATQADLDTVVSAHTAFVGKTPAVANTPYTVTATTGTTDGLYDIVAIDEAGNVSSALDGWLTVDNTVPTINLAGVNPMTVNRGDAYVEPVGTTATDAIDGSIVPVITGTVDTTTNGSYLITYTATDTAGNTTSSTRVVNVIAGSFNITATVGANGAIDPSGITSVALGASQAYSINAYSGFGIDTLTIDGVLAVPTTTHTFSNVTADHTIDVTFKDITAPVVSLVGSAAISVTRDAPYTDAGATALDNVDVTSTVSPSISGMGYNYVNTAVLGVYTIIYSSTDAAGNTGTATRTVTVTLSLTYDITAEPTTNGTITPSGTNSFDVNATPTYTITPNAGYTVATLTIDGTPYAPVTSYTFAPITEIHTIAATFSALPDTTKPTITVTPATVPLTVGDSYTLVDALLGVTASDTHLGNTTDLTSSISVGGVPLTNLQNQDYTITYSVTDGSGNTQTATRTLHVTYSTTYNIVASSGANGTVSPTGTTPVTAHGSQIYNITPSAGYSIGTITLDTGTASEINIATISPYTFTNVTADHAITATFTLTPDRTAPVITVNTVNGSKDVTVTQNTAYTDAGATAFDAFDNASSMVITTGSVTTSVLGDYVVLYRSTDLAGNTSFDQRTVSVVAAASLPTIEFTAPTSGTGAESVLSVSIPLTLSAISASNVLVDYTVTGTATGGGVDYTLASGTATITAEQTTTNITATIVDDILDEVDETVILTLTTATGAQISPTNNVYTYTITDDDTAPTIQFTSASGTGAESVTPVNIPVSLLSTASGKNITVNYSVTGGTATSGVDYVLVSGTATIAAGSTTTNISMTVIDDTIKEASETVIVTLTSPTDATLGTSEFTYTITDNEPDLSVGFVDVTSSRPESVTSTNINLALSSVSTQEVTINYTVTGTATDTTDYTIAASPLIIPANTPTAQIPITIVSDSTIEPNETIIITLTSSTNASLGVNNTIHTYTILNDDADDVAPVITLTQVNSLDAVTVIKDSVASYTDAGATIIDVVDGTCTLGDTSTNPTAGTCVYSTSGVVNTTAVSATPYTFIYTARDSSGNISSLSRSVTVAYAPTYSITATAGLNGTIVADSPATMSPEGVTAVPSTTSQSYTITPASGYGIDTLTVDGQAVASLLTYTFTNVIANHTIAVTFTASPDVVVPVITVTGDNPMSVILGSSFTDPGATASDDRDGVLTSSIVATGTVNPNAIGAYTITYNVSDAAKNKAITATRTVNVVYASEYTITVTAGLHGSVSPTTGPVASQVDHTFTITPEVDYKISSLLIDGLAEVPTTPDSYVFTNVIADHTLAVTFSLQNALMPVITLNEPNPMNIYTGDVFANLDPGATAVSGVGDPLVVTRLNTVDTTTASTGNRVTYSATDADGNISTKDRTVNVLDITPPVITDVAVPVITNTAAAITWTTNEPATSQVSYGTATGSLTRTTIIDNTKSIYHVVTLSSSTDDMDGNPNLLVENVPYFYTVSSTDTSGNPSVSDENTFTTVPVVTRVIVVDNTPVNTNTTNNPFNDNTSKFIPDVTAPVISDLKIDDITAFEATVNFTTDEETLSFVEYGKTSKYGDNSANNLWSTEHSIKLRGLRLGTDYHIKVTAVDKSGNAATSEDQKFKTKFFSENTSDLVNVDNVQQFQDEIEATIESILPALIPPFIEEPKIIDITENSATISFRTNIKTFSVVGYVEDGSFDTTKANPYLSESSDTSEKTFEHKLMLLNLKSNMKYHLQAKAFSLPQVVGKSEDITFTTKASKIKGSIIQRTKDSFVVVWNTDVPTSSMVEYKNLKSGEKSRIIDSVNKILTHSIRVENLTPGTSYEVRISGVNDKGNVVEGNNVLKVTTLVDITPPKITNFKVESSLVVGRTDRVQTVVSWQTDEASTSTVYYEEGSGSPDKPLANKQQDLELTINHVVVLTILKPGTVYRFTVESLDDAGNRTKPPIRTIITPKKAESIVDVIFKNFDDTFNFLQNVK